MARVNVVFDGVSRGVKRAGGETRNEIRQVRQESDKANRSALSLGSTLRSTLGLGAKVAAGGIAALAGSVVFAGFKFDDLKQKAQIAFTTMLGDGGKARAFLGELQQFANRTPFEFPDLIRTSQRLLAMGVNARDVIPSLTAIGDAVASLGGGAEQINQVTLAIGQMGLKGRAQSEEMLQLTEAGINGWKYLARALNVDVARAQEMVTKRMVDGRFAQRAILAGMEADFHGSMDRQSHTFSGLWSTIKDTFTQVSGTVMKPFFDLAVRGMQRLVDQTSRPEFTRGVQDFADRLANEAVPAIQNSIGWLVDHRGEIVGVLKAIAENGRDVAIILKQAATNANQVAKAMGGWDDAFQLILAGTLASKLGLASKNAASLKTNLRSIAAIGTLSIAIELGLKAGTDVWLRDIATNLQNLKKKPTWGNLLNFLIGSPGRRGFVGNMIGGDGSTTGSGGVPGEEVTGNASPKRSSIVSTAQTQLGIPYQWGGAAVLGGHTDCSGLAQAVLRKNGISVGRTTYEQWRQGRPVMTPQPGDLVFFHMGARGPEHVGIYIGNDQFIHDPHTGDRVKVSKLSTFGGFAGARTYVPATTSKTAPTPTTTPDTGDDITPGDNPLGGGAGGKPKKVPIITGLKLLSRDLRVALAKARGTAGDADDLREYQRDLAALKKMRGSMHGEQRAALEQEISKTQRAITTIEETHAKSRNAKLKARLKEAADAWKKHLDELKAKVTEQRGVFEEAFSRMASRALDAFDRQTRSKLDTLDLERAQLTPSEQRLADLQSGRAQASRDKAIADARAALDLAKAHAAATGPVYGDDPQRIRELADAKQDLAAAEAALAGDAADATKQRFVREGRERVVDLQEQLTDAREKWTDQQKDDVQQAQRDVVDAQQQLDDALYEQQLFDLQQAADAERRERDKQFETRKQQLDDERAAERDQLQDRLNDLKTFLSERNTSLKTANDELLAIARQFGIDIAALNILPVIDALGGFRGATYDTMGPGEILRAIGADDPALRNYLAQGRKLDVPGFAAGGRVGGAYVGRNDTVAARLTQGEEVIDRSLSQQLRAALANGGLGGSLVLDFSGLPVFATQRQLEDFVAELAAPGLDRQIDIRVRR